MEKQSVAESGSINELVKDMLSLELTPLQMEDFVIGSNLSDKQQIAFESFKRGENLAILSFAGSGKSLCLKTMEEYNNTLENHKKMYLCATTGVAAYNIGGMTIHSFMNFGTGDLDIISLVKKIGRSKETVNKLKSEHILVIDEISMLSASLFEKINLIYQHFRKNKSFMGGVQLIITGDLLQTECIFNKNKDIYKETEDTRLIIESDIFNKVYNEKSINILTENFRQKNDTVFMDLLLRIRKGRHTGTDIDLLTNKCLNFNNEYAEKLKSGITPVNLVTTNAKAQNINEMNLRKITYPSYRYTASFVKKGTESKTIDILQKELTSQFRTKGLLEMVLKQSARVMLIKNLDTSVGLVNGAVGTIININEIEIEVLFDNGITRIIGRAEWVLEMENNQVKIKQIPITLAYALTIHKSISLTLDTAIMELADCFAPHMVYLALSRVKTLDGLLLKTFNQRKIVINSKILEYLEEYE